MDQLVGRQVNINNPDSQSGVKMRSVSDAHDHNLEIV